MAFPIQKAIESAVKDSIEEFFAASADHISTTSRDGHMRHAQADEHPLFRDEGDQGPIRILHESHRGTYRTFIKGVEHVVDIDPGRLARSLIFEGLDSPPPEQILRVEVDTDRSVLEFGTSVPYAHHEDRFEYLAGALDEVKLDLPHMLNAALAEGLTTVQAKEEIKVRVRL